MLLPLPWYATLYTEVFTLTPDEEFGEETSGTGRIHANYRITFMPNGAVVMQIGGESADGRQPGVIFSGTCRGKYERFESDIPPPATVTARTRAAASKVGWLR